MRKTWWALVLACAFCGLAMAAYPGGTVLDPATVGYSFSGNFFSDLGRAVAFNGRSNALGAILFVLSLGSVLFGFGVFFVRLVRLFSGDATLWAWAGAAAGALVIAAFAGVAMTPEDRFWTAHVFFTCWAFRIAPLVAVFLGVATFKEHRFPRYTGLVWVVLAAALSVYVALMEIGPRTDTLHGLRTQVLAQKFVTIVGILAVAYQGYQASRIPRAPAQTAVVVDHP